MNRLSYALGAAYIALCAVAVARADKPVEVEIVTPPRPRTPERAPVPAREPTGSGWFGTIKQYCNTVEAETALQRYPAPGGFEGTGYQAACLALAGKIDRARALIETLDRNGRGQAASIVFGVAHPVADQGDDRSAGPIMAMVVDFLPDHYMALYHAGMSEAALGDGPSARRHLEAFLRIYQQQDGWRSSARATLDRLAQ